MYVRTKVAHIQYQNETKEEREIRIQKILHRNSRPYECDFCDSKYWTEPTNIGSSEHKIYACKKCLASKKLLTPRLTLA